MSYYLFGLPLNSLKAFGFPVTTNCELFFWEHFSADNLFFYSLLPNLPSIVESRVYIVSGFGINLDNISERYMIQMKTDEANVEVIAAEVNDDYSDDSLFNISSWGADLSFRELISMYEENELVKPELQRKYVWDKAEASRFIESILLGLPVPSIFLAQSGSQKLIVDGYQRIMTVYDYVRGIFTTDGKVFEITQYYQDAVQLVTIFDSVVH